MIAMICLLKSDLLLKNIKPVVAKRTVLRYNDSK